MKIPVANIYYLLCYAWNKLAEQQVVAVDAEACATLPDLFARVLHNGVAYVLKRGIDRNYLDQEAVLAGVRGKINFTASVQQNLLVRQHTYCRYDELSPNILPNQILKTTIGRLLGLPGLDPLWSGKLRLAYRRFQEVDTIVLSPQIFHAVRLNRLNQFYEFLLRVCELLYHNLLPTEHPGRYRFYDFTKDDEQMAYVFEEFVRNFYRFEQQAYSVRRENIAWQYASAEPAAGKLLPTMQTDLSLRRPGQVIIMDCKYYRAVFENRFGQDKIRSTHLYQLHAYLSQAAKWEKPGMQVSGILLYATDYALPPASFDSGDGLRLDIRVLNLAQHWSGIGGELLGILGQTGGG
ncbi:MAG: hypothetical protein ABIQ93_02090 [Saprospiraceae bacterium]